MKKQLLFSFLGMLSLVQAQTIQVNLLGRYVDGRDAACEISAYDKDAQKLYITNAAADSLDIVDVSDMANPVKVGQIDVLSYGGGVNSVVALGGGYIATAIEANTKQDSGFVVFFDTAGNFVSQVTVGALPDMVTVTHDGTKVLVANEGEPSDDYMVDPEGSVAIIDISGGVDNVSQSDVTIIRLNAAPSSITGSIRKQGVAWEKDLEPEYIAISEDDSKAFVACQESNVLLVIDIDNATVDAFKGLGFKDHSLAENKLDPSNRDSGINMANWNVKGVYQPDAIAAYTVAGNTYVLSANEGDGRDYAGYSWEQRIKDHQLDTVVFPNHAFLQQDSNLGRLTSFTPDVIGDTDNDGFIEELYCYGGRSFTIWDASGNLVWDSGDDFEMYIKENHEEWFNCNDGAKTEFDERSDDKGPEPEAITVGRLRNQFFAFVGLERQGGIMVYNITDPMNPSFETYIEEFDENSGVMTDIAPEGLIFVPASESHNGKNVLIVSNEVSGSTTIYEIVDLFAGVEEMASSSVLNVYPNPTDGQLNLSNSFTNEVNYNVFNTSGSLLHSGRLGAGQKEINVSNLPNGIYQLQVINEASISITRFVKQ